MTDRDVVGRPGVEGRLDQAVDRGRMSACRIHSSICASGTMRVRPSEHSRNRSPARTSSRSKSRRKRRLDSDGPRDGIRHLPPGGPIRLLDAMVARQLLQPPRSPSIDPAVAGPEDRAAHPRTSNTTTVLALRSVDDRAARRAKQVIVHASNAGLGVFDRLVEAPSGAMSASASQTIRLATSPSRCPPRPSATAQRPTSGRSTKASSLILRTRPTSVAAADRKRNGAAGSAHASVRARWNACRCAREPRTTRAAPRSRRASHRTCSAAASPERSGNWARPPTSPRSTTSRAARRSMTSEKTAAARTTAPGFRDTPIGICQQSGDAPFTMAPAAASSTISVGTSNAARSSPSAMTRSSKRSKSTSSAASVSMTRRSALLEEGRRLGRRGGAVDVCAAARR